jgi:hypothetical protein
VEYLVIADKNLFRGPTKPGKTDLSEAESYLVGFLTSATVLSIPRRHAAKFLSVVVFFTLICFVRGKSQRMIPSSVLYTPMLSSLTLPRLKIASSWNVTQRTPFKTSSFPYYSSQFS